MSLLRIINSNIYKEKHGIFYGLHVILPLILAFLVTAYYKVNQTMTPETHFQIYFNLLTLALPFIGSLVVAFDMEREASGGYQGMLCCGYSKLGIWCGKLLFLLGSGVLAIVLAVGSYALSMTVWVGETKYGWGSFAAMTGIVIGGQAALYMFHMLLSMWTSQSAVIGIGLLESVLAALLLTGLGDGIWMYFPCAWGTRMCDAYMLYLKTGFAFQQEAGRVLPVMAGITLAAAILSAGSFYRLSGRRRT